MWHPYLRGLSHKDATYVHVFVRKDSGDLWRVRASPASPNLLVSSPRYRWNGWCCVFVYKDIFTWIAIFLLLTIAERTEQRISIKVTGSKLCFYGYNLETKQNFCSGSFHPNLGEKACQVEATSSQCWWCHSKLTIQ